MTIRRRYRNLEAPSRRIAPRRFVPRLVEREELRTCIMCRSFEQLYPGTICARCEAELGVGA
jgi:hypothetical protein